MFKNVGIVTAVVLLSFLVSLGLGRGIIAVVLKTMRSRSSSLMGSKAQLPRSSRPKPPVESRRPTNARTA
jgi:hypothetical protein